MSAHENYAEIHARPGEYAGTFFIRCAKLAEEIGGTVFGTHNGTRVAVDPGNSGDQALQEWAKARYPT
jgi:hypothetical protein